MRRTQNAQTALFLACAAAAVFTVTARAQFGRGVGDWMTAGSDAQRSSWIRSDGKISKDSLQNPGFQFLWKLQLDGKAKHPLAPPLLLNSYIGYRGFRSLAFVGLTSDQVAAVDTDLARLEWRQQLPASRSDSPCGTATVALTRPTTAAFPSQAGGRGFGGRGGPAHSGVGEPDEGAVTLKLTPLAPPPGFGPAPAMPGAPGTAARPAPNAFPPGFGRPMAMHAVTRDGMFHTLYVSNGESAQPPVQFVPAHSKLQGLVAIDGIAYAAVGHDCDAAPDEMIALDLNSKEVATYKLKGGAIAGSPGFSLGPDGTLYFATTDGDLISLEPKTFKVKATYKAGQAFASSPVVFEYKGKILIAASTKDGRIHLLDSAGQPSLAKTDPASFVVGALQSWQDLAGTRWLLGPSNVAVIAWKVVDRNGTLSLQPGWTSRNLAAPLAPIVINGVVFTASTGSAPMLYALDASTGKELWHSSQIASTAGGGLSVGNSQVYMGTNDGTLYAFGFPMEH